MTVSEENFRQVMRRIPSGVCILTTGTDNEIAGMTISSLFSLSLDPPVLVVAINMESTTYRILAEKRNFGISVPLSKHQPLLELFSSAATRGSDRFTLHQWRVGKSGVPLLVDASATIECSVLETIPRNTHAIVVGKVESCSVAERGSSLAYWNGEYYGLIGS